MELPIDHFRLIGVSPSADAEAVLRAFQLRVDRPPHQGFTQEVLGQRADLLKLSTDLLANKALREEYEKALLGGASGLELSSIREVAGLILLWEAGSSPEAFNLARKALQPPQAPALGSGREADLTLVAALSCKAAALQEQEQRHFQLAAEFLQEGIHLLQRMGKLPDQRQELEKELDELLPYRILDLLSRDLSDQEAHQQGLDLLDSFVMQRGGLEGKNSSNAKGGLSQGDFELFFQQIRGFLTVQEQIDLFDHWQRKGSETAGFLCAISLVSSGFSRRKPERLQEAKKYLKSFSSKGLDLMPLLGCIDLLLADIEKAHSRFRNSGDEELKKWLDTYPGETLGALCDYCRNWLKKDVLVGFRDVEIESVDLEAWFADRDVQDYLEKLEWKGARGIAKAGFSFLSSLSNENDPINNSENELKNSVDQEINEEESKSLEEIKEENDENYQDKSSISSLFFSALSNGFKQKSLIENETEEDAAFTPRPLFVGTFIVALLLVCGGLINSARIFYFEREEVLVEEELVERGPAKPAEKELSSNDKDEINSPKPIALKVQPLISENPTEPELLNLLDAWLSGKAAILAGKKSDELPKVARTPLVKRVKAERDKDKSLGEVQVIQTMVKSLKVLDRTTKRIALEVVLQYKEKRINKSGNTVSETSIPALKVRYILGREKDTWQLVAYTSGN